MKKLNNKRTIREIGGEIWAELSKIDNSIVDWKAKQDVVDLVMKILAKYDGFKIENDKDLPVTPFKGEKLHP